MRLSYPNSPAALEKLEDDLAQFGQSSTLDARTLTALHLALDEALSNIIGHAFPEGGEHAIAVELEPDRSGVTATIRDDGRPFDPIREGSAARPGSNGAGAEGHAPGMGMYLMRTLMDELHYVREDGHNVLRLRKRATSKPRSTAP
jgi:anti-sigma regulatory factor (Ser/Thr protein kinase)